MASKKDKDPGADRDQGQEPPAAEALQEERLGMAMVKARLLSEAQLRTSLDYQRSLGGAISEVIQRLGFVPAAAMKHFLDGLPPQLAAEPEAAPQRPAPLEERGKGLRKEFQRREAPPRIAPVDAGPLDSELATQRSNIPERAARSKRAPEGEGVSVALEALLTLLVEKGVITAGDEETLRALAHHEKAHDH